MAIIEIQKGTPNAHRRVQEWRRANQDGFLLNYKSRNDATLHKSLCPKHLGDTEREEGRDNWGSFGNSTKVLSLNRNELEQWANDRQAKLKLCGDCQP